MNAGILYKRGPYWIPDENSVKIPRQLVVIAIFVEKTREFRCECVHTVVVEYGTVFVLYVFVFGC